ncbi:MAG: guanine deaminase [Oligoflexia bacterium]|nr:guanine deaminase [Oligoflexia bacterium]
MIAHRARWIFSCQSATKLDVWEDGCLVIGKDSRIAFVGPTSQGHKKYPKAQWTDHGKSSVLMPGFVDCHVHGPQIDMVGSAGQTLLRWLKEFAYPAELKYQNAAHANKGWKKFACALASSGTTHAAVYSTSSLEATESLMAELDRWGLRAHVGPVLMDRHAPRPLIGPASRQISGLQQLIKKWKQHPRIKPSIVLRFVPTSTKTLLELTSKIRQKYSDLIFQSHLAETQEEIKWVKKLYPKHRNYTAVYSDHELLNDRSLLGHGIYLERDELKLLKKFRSSVIHCPSSNLFLGSGLFSLKKVRESGVAVALGSDVGAGTSLFMPSVARSAYEVQALQGHFLSSAELLWLITGAGSKALGQKDSGTLARGMAADFVVLDGAYDPVLSDRMANAKKHEDRLAAILMLSHQSHVKLTCVDGKSVYRRD